MAVYGLSGFCYTQLTDVFQEQNGIYFFDRSRKLDVDRLRAIQSRPAAIEVADSGTSTSLKKRMGPAPSMRAASR